MKNINLLYKAKQNKNFSRMGSETLLTQMIIVLLLDTLFEEKYFHTLKTHLYSVNFYEYVSFYT